ncbi:DUF4272 domain-containing protein [Chryseobacterium polytrichastri]|uniref:DUF4272 domain-containing protein n=1 Tax=Chryseobacterium polytrichastri TaxID=1302687 RepID=A0A1M6TJ56_9FLAO|nr:DUF4272 domain-containing protein [Chryseobacterium polytrichastri]SHK57025.1 protein of unknown function [Chryseobacterium polytrichastri]
MTDILKNKEELSRKEKTHEILKKEGIKINVNLPYIESEEETTLRTPKEVATRAAILSITNLVSFDSIDSEEAISYLEECNLWEHTTSDEKDFLQNPTEDKKFQETWKSECIWVLLWALQLVENIPFPNELCDLNDIALDKYPIGGDNDPNEFIKTNNQLRSKAEILDTNDLYYRYHWACVDARLNNLEMTTIDSGILYERQYALNWLVNYMGQEWDDVSCDT